MGKPTKAATPPEILQFVIGVVENLGISYLEVLRANIALSPANTQVAQNFGPENALLLEMIARLDADTATNQIPPELAAWARTWHDLLRQTYRLTKS